MSRIRKRRSAVTPYEPAPLPYHPRNQIGFGRFPDALPLTPDADVSAIKRHERYRDMLLAADPEWWAGE